MHCILSDREKIILPILQDLLKLNGHGQLALREGELEMLDKTISARLPNDSSIIFFFNPTIYT